MLRSSAPRLFARAAAASGSASASAPCASTVAGPSRAASASSSGARSASRSSQRVAFSPSVARASPTAAAAAVDARAFATHSAVPSSGAGAAGAGYHAAIRRLGKPAAVETRSLNPLPTAAALQQWAASTPLPALPDDVLSQAVTHDSYDLGLTNATGGHNRRLQFLGRRALFLYYALLSPSSGPSDVQAALHTSHLGETAGRALALHEAMRWTPARDGDEKTSGLWTIRGSVVEALVGAVYHQHGALAARAFCHAHVFPHLKLKEAVSTKVQELGDEARAQLAALSRSAAAASPRAAAAAQAQAQAASAPPPPPVVESPAAAKMHGELP